MKCLKIEALLGKKTIIIGPLNSGKTLLLAEIVKKLTQKGLKDEILILDFAPPRMGKIGGKLSDYIILNKLLYFYPEKVYAPRYEGKSREEVIKLAEENRRLLERYLDNAAKINRKILIINDITLYLHRGKLEKVLKLMKSKETVIITAYCGDEFNDKGSNINLREKAMVGELMEYVDIIIKTPVNRENEAAKKV